MAPTKVKGINHYSRFFYNFNYSCGVILIPVLISIVIGVMILAQKSMDTKKKLSLAFTTFLYEYTFTILMFSGYLISISFGI